MPTPQAEMPICAADPQDVEISLREAEQRSGRSERTLRRKLESGQLQGRKIILENGCEAWSVCLQSLLALYPDAEVTGWHVPQGGGGTHELEDCENVENTDSSTLGTAATPLGNESALPPPPPRQPSALPPPPSADEIPSDPRDFFGYLYQENKHLKQRISELEDELITTKHQAGKWEGEAGATERFRTQLYTSHERLQQELMETRKQLELLEHNPPRGQHPFIQAHTVEEARPPQKTDEASPVSTAAGKWQTIIFWGLLLLLVLSNSTRFIH